ncbi:MAG: deaminase, partial [Microgenomates group bacterium]
VLHQGYVNLITSHPKIEQIFLFSDMHITRFRPLVKDIRALSPEKMLVAIAALFPQLNPKLLSLDQIEEMKRNSTKIITPEDELLTPLVRELFPDNLIETDSVFLRWDKKRSTSRNDVTPNDRVSRQEFDQKIISLSKKESEQSSDWWRQVGAVLVSPENEVLLTGRNRHLPHDQQHYSDGDPRADFQSGENIEITSSIHAETQLLATAAKRGIKTEGCSLYVSTFPCPVCAKLVAASGIKKVFFIDGYSLVDGEQVFESAGVELIQVETD